VVQIIQICSRTKKWSAALVGLASTIALACPVSAASRPDLILDDYMAARLAEIAQDNQQAQSGYAKLLKQVPSSLTVADRLFASAIRSGDMANAIKAVRAQELQNTASAEAPLLLFADAYRRNDWEMAKLAGAELAARTQYGFMTPILSAWLNVAQKSPANLPPPSEGQNQALAYFAMPQRIYLKLAVGELPEAKANLLTIQSANADFIEDLNIRAAPIFAANGDEEFANALIRKAMDGDALKASHYSKSSRKLNAQDGLAALHLHVANSLLAQKQPEQALVFIRIAEYYVPGDIAAQLSLGNAMAAIGATKTAQAILRSVPPASPYWSQAVATLAQAYTSEGRFEEAAMLIGKARRQKPLSVSLALLAARNFEDTKELASAAIIYKDLMLSADQSKTAPGQAAIFRMLLANVVEKQGDWPSAKGLLETAFKLDPNNPYILNSFGYSMLEHKDDSILAMELLKKAHSLAPDSAVIADSLGWAYFRNGDFAKSIPLLESAAKTSGNDLTINEHLGDAYWSAGRRIEARYAWKVALLTADGEPASRLVRKVDFGLGIRLVNGKP
jgi:tetratricopeptide (TPR) repeat protein